MLFHLIIAAFVPVLVLGYQVVPCKEKFSFQVDPKSFIEMGKKLNSYRSRSSSNQWTTNKHWYWWLSIITMPRPEWIKRKLCTSIFCWWVHNFHHIMSVIWDWIYNSCGCVWNETGHESNRFRYWSSRWVIFFLNILSVGKVWIFEFESIAIQMILVVWWK